MLQLRSLVKAEVLKAVRDVRVLLLMGLLPALLAPCMAYFLLSFANTYTRVPRGKPTVKLQADGPVAPALADWLERHGVNLVSGDAAADVEILLRPDPTGETLAQGDIVYDSSSRASVRTFEQVGKALAALSRAIAVRELAARNVPVSLVEPLRFTPQDRARPFDMTGLFLGFFLVMGFSTWPVLTALQTAIDVGAGERERRALEPYFATPVSPLTLVLAKFCAVFAAAFGGTAIALGTSWLVFLAAAGPSVRVSVQASQWQWVPLIALAACLWSSAVTVVISLLSRGIKEAVLYMVPLNLLGYFALMLTFDWTPGAAASSWYVAPILNYVLLARDIAGGSVQGYHALLTAVSLVVWSATALVMGAGWVRRAATSG